MQPSSQQLTLRCPVYSVQTPLFFTQKSALGTGPRGKTAVIWILSRQFGHIVQLFSDVKIQDLKVHLELKMQL